MNKRFLFIAAAGATLALGSCSTIQGLLGSSKRTRIPATEVQRPAEAEAAHTDLSPRALAGRWMITSVGKTTVSGYEDEWPYIEFAPSEGRFYGSNACNVINGSYAVHTGQLMELSNIATTMRMCPDDTLAYPIARALDAVRSYSIATRKGSQILSLHNEKHLTVMTLRNTDILFLNGPWQVTAIGQNEVENPDVRLVIDVNENKVHGNTGCNILNGTITQDPLVSSSVQFSDLITTRMACRPGDDTEQRLLIALEEVATARRMDNDRVELLSQSGRHLLTISRLSKADL
ncbi:MAG: META domain-containing protein [Muribaculaceae bacterium]|nr:META domain-containing protein [Muribaculaceae bacterium]